MASAVLLLSLVALVAASEAADKALKLNTFSLVGDSSRLVLQAIATIVFGFVCLLVCFFSMCSILCLAALALV